MYRKALGDEFRLCSDFNCQRATSKWPVIPWVQMRSMLLLF